MPARARDFFRALKKFGVTIETATGGGSHFKAKKDGHRTYPLTLHNGEKSEVDDKYIRLACENFGIDEAELRKLL